MRLYQAFSTEAIVLLNERNRHHVVNVMRCREGDDCFIFDGEGKECRARILRITKTEVALEIIAPIENNHESSLTLHVFQALCKGDKMDWIIQKAVELGACSITPLTTARSEIKLTQEKEEKKREHWHHIMIHACQQSGRAVLPKLNPVMTLDKALSSEAATALFFTPTGKETLSGIFPKINVKAPISLWIGPEGGWSTTEIQWAEEKKIATVSLGSRILRTETAALSALIGLQTLCGDF